MSTKVRLDRGPQGLYYSITKIERGPKDGQDYIVQSDWDYPSLARDFGWQPCHEVTDGTVDCSICGKTATELICAAMDYLDEHDGEITRLDDELAECYGLLVA